MIKLKYCWYGIKQQQTNTCILITLAILAVAGLLLDKAMKLDRCPAPNKPVSLHVHHGKIDSLINNRVGFYLWSEPMHFASIYERIMWLSRVSPVMVAPVCLSQRDNPPPPPIEQWLVHPDTNRGYPLAMVMIGFQCGRSGVPILTKSNQCLTKFRLVATYHGALK